MKVYIKTFGCRVNQVESQSILEEFLKRGHTIIEDFKVADMCILNTCTVTHNADKDVEKAANQITKNNPKAKLILTGCYAAAHGEKIKQKYPLATIVFKLNVGPALFGQEINWTVQNHQGHSRAFVKIQDGCDCFCSYCIVPFTRPHKTSKPKDIVLGELKKLIANNYHEIVLTGINIGNYLCPQTGANLAALVRDIFALPGNFRIRFSSIELNTLTDELLNTMQNPRFCNYLHLPLQSGSDAVLKHMHRHYTTGEYQKRVLQIRQKLPGIGLFCDIIAGYPTETAADFEITQNFINQINFAGLHVFSYSVRPNTVAGALAQLAPCIIKERAQALRVQDAKLRQNFAALQMGSTHMALLEDYAAATNTLSGVLGNFQRVLIPNTKPQKGLASVKIISVNGDVCTGALNLI